MKKVCIIGGGVGGLTALKNVLENSDFSAVVYERAGSIGGVWRYCEKKGTPETMERFPTPVYKNLTMNVPHMACELLDFPWPETTNIFPTRQQASDYLHRYADTFKLKEHIKFHHQVINVKPIDPNNRENPRWNVAVKDLEFGNVTTHEFDIVLVCTRRDIEPNFPNIPNIEEFTGSVITADKYTSPEVYQGMKVLLLGGGPSGIDISLDILPFAKEVIVSCKPLPKIFNLVQAFSLRIRKVAPWKSATLNGIILEDSTELEGIDAVILATGYDYNYDFLASECGISIEKGKRVSFLYRHMVNVKFPSMCFINVSFYAPAFYSASIQSKWIMKTLDGTIKLPNESDMMVDIMKSREEIVSFGFDEFNFAHHIFIQQWSLSRELSKEGGFELVPYVEQVFTHIVPRLFTDPANFRKDIYRKIDKNTVHIEIAPGAS